MITKCPDCQMTFADNAMMRHNCREKEDLIEKIADFMHMQWSHWQKYVHSKMTDLEKNGVDYMGITYDDYLRWERQMETPYSQLSEKEKDSDREFARKLIELLDL